MATTEETTFVKEIGPAARTPSQPLEPDTYHLLKFQRRRDPESSGFCAVIPC